MLDKLVARLSALRLTLVRGKVRAPRPRAAPAPPWDAALRESGSFATAPGDSCQGGSAELPRAGC